jgi:hypothetical protein
MCVEHWWNKYRLGKPNVALSNTNLAWIDLGSKPGLRGERPVNNSLGMAQPKEGNKLEI